MDYVKFYLDWASNVARIKGVNTRWWVEHHGWKKVCLLMEAGEEAIDKSLEEWREPELPFVSK
jgi:hypothetical protein